MTKYHIPALLSESIEGLNIDPDGIYVDVTFGGGSHSRAILDKLVNGRLISFDKDRETEGDKLKDEKFTFVHNDFIFLKNFLRYFDAIPIDGIIADLGVSSHQFDSQERGFSHRFDAELDMRMDKDITITAKNILKEYSQKELQRIFSNYGEIRNSKVLSNTIVESRIISPINTTKQLTEIIKQCVRPRDNYKKYLSLVFQALRITVNDELEALKKLVDQSRELLRSGGRIAIISYHSLEDRIVKNYFRTGNFEGKLEKDIYGNISTPFVIINKKPIQPSAEEIENNPRARSAKLRIAEKV